MLLAEVMDKMPAITIVWSIFLALGALGLLLARVRQWLGIAATAFVVLISSMVVIELHDPIIGPAIVAEAGMKYVVQTYAAMSIGIGLPLVGALWGFYAPGCRSVV